MDYNTEGLLLLTNDGDLAQKLTHPKHEVNKTYRVTVPGLVPQDKLDLLRIGVKLEDGMTAPAIVTLIGYDNEKVIQLLISLFMKAVTVKCAECVILLGFL